MHTHNKNKGWIRMIVSEPRRLSIIPMVLLVLLSACSTDNVKLSSDHLQELKQAFVGREFVFRVDWHLGMVIYKGRPENNIYATMYNKTPSVNRHIQDLGAQVAEGGEVARITSVMPVANHRLYLGFKTRQGAKGTLIIFSPNNESWGTEFYQDLTDQTASIAWVEEQLTRKTIRFLGSEDVPASAASAPLSRPPVPVQLTPPPGKSRQQETGPEVTGLRVIADPPQLKRGESVSLSLEYRIASANQPVFEVTEKRLLSFDGKRVPRYPKEQVKTLSEGRHSSNFRQKIPAGAKTGVYVYQGEVCIADRCSSESVEFEVLP